MLFGRTVRNCKLVVEWVDGVHLLQPDRVRTVRPFPLPTPILFLYLLYLSYLSYLSFSHLAPSGCRTPFLGHFPTPLFADLACSRAFLRSPEVWILHLQWGFLDFLRLQVPYRSPVCSSMTLRGCSSCESITCSRACAARVEQIHTLTFI